MAEASNPCLHQVLLKMKMNFPVNIIVVQLSSTVFTFFMSVHLYLIVSPVRSTYGGYYGLVRRYAAASASAASASAFHRLRDNFKNPYRIASIFDMQIDIGERIAGKQDWPGLIIYGPPRAPRIAKNTHFLYIVGRYMKNSLLFFSLVIHMSAL